MEPIDPLNVASKANTPPSPATKRYPLPSRSGTRPLAGLLSRMLPVEPANRALPKENTPPSLPSIQ